MNLYEFKNQGGNLAVGTEVAIGGRHGYSFGKIVKFTPSGQFTVESSNGHPYRFTAEGRPHGHSAWLEFDVADAQRQVMLQAAKSTAIHAINDVASVGTVRTRYAGKALLEEMVKSLEEKVAAARAAVNLIPNEDDES